MAGIAAITGVWSPTSAGRPGVRHPRPSIASLQSVFRPLLASHPIWCTERWFIRRIGGREDVSACGSLVRSSASAGLFPGQQASSAASQQGDQLGARSFEFTAQEKAQMRRELHSLNVGKVASLCPHAERGSLVAAQHKPLTQSRSTLTELSALVENC